MLDHVIRTLHRGVFSFAPSVNTLRGTRGFLRNSGPYGFSKPWETPRSKSSSWFLHSPGRRASLSNCRSCVQRKQGWTALLWDFYIVVVNLGPSGCWEPQGHGRLAEKMSASWWPSGILPASGLPFWYPNSQWVFRLSSQGEHDPVPNPGPPVLLEAGNSLYSHAHMAAKGRVWPGSNKTRALPQSLPADWKRGRYELLEGAKNRQSLLWVDQGSWEEEATFFIGM